MEHGTGKIKKSILIPLGAVLLALLAITIFSAQRGIGLQFKKEMEDSVIGAQQTYEAALDKDAEIMQALLEFIKDDKELQHAWLAQDRDALLRRAQPIFAELKPKYRVTHFYFHGLDKVNFLRVHQPPRHGDTIKRFTLKEAVATQQVSWGVELGPLGTFTLRVVLPWYIDGNLAGYLELGEEISHISKQISETLGIHLMSVINKKFVDRARWEEGMRMLGMQANWDLYQQYVVSDNPLHTLPADFDQKLRAHAEKEHSLFLFNSSMEGQDHHGGIIALRDVSGREVGKFIVMRNVAAKKALLQRLSFTQAMSFSIFGIGLYFLFWGYLGRLEKLLVDRRRLLETEIIEHRQSEAALTKSEERYRDLFESAHDLILILDPEGHILYANRSWREKIGYESSEFSDLSFADIITGDCTPNCQDTFQRLLTEGSLTKIKMAFHNKYGKKISVEGSANCKYIAGEVVSIRCIFRDVTEHEELKEQLYQSQKTQAIGTLAGGIAHDFNNILTAIIGYSQLLERQIPQDNPAWSNLQEVLKAGIRAKDLVKQILTFSRQRKSELQPTDIHLVLSEVMQLLRSTIPTTIDIKQNISSSNAIILTDPGQLHQVIMNLCTNAFHAMGETGGQLTISLDAKEIAKDELRDVEPGPYIRLKISDTGCGMDHATLTRIFEPYFTTKDPGSGTGLGLSVVHGIVEKHHGHIFIESTPGNGTTVSLYFPKVAAAISPKEKEILKSIPGGDENILVVDDEKSIVELHRLVLESLGYKVTTCTQSGKALEIFRSHPGEYDLVITDMAMPKMTGAELAQQLIALRPTIPIILCTGFSGIITEDNAKALGIQEYIMKPIIEKDIALAVSRVFGRA